MVHERSFIMVKPDGVQRGLVGEIIKRFEHKGFKLVAMKFMVGSDDLFKQHYAALSSQAFFPGLIKFSSSGPVVAMVWEGVHAVAIARAMVGQTDPAASAAGSIRGDLCIHVGRNVIHASDSLESAKKEVSLWFTDKEIVSWASATESYVHEG
ncbi:hypothetical protein PPYR_09976 [Photinus pyralis]|uniref:Nucleoside diphosphate kinase n=1 Tax=Photinus pyralis TaxID=7054 RepID=A0A1Y1N3B5_PHOPY|nr:nucleoside diphosphate kinase-like [Photinus pyralis]KAB0795915.1 hypothetical protein PPYR_09976 [Photinus pyralis]